MIGVQKDREMRQYDIDVQTGQQSFTAVPEMPAAVAVHLPFLKFRLRGTVFATIHNPDPRFLYRVELNEETQELVVEAYELSQE
jgi:hypothetical protein